MNGSKAKRLESEGEILRGRLTDKDETRKELFTQLGYMQTNDHLNGIATTEDAVRSQLFKDFVIQRL